MTDPDYTKNPVMEWKLVVTAPGDVPESWEKLRALGHALDYLSDDPTLLPAAVADLPPGTTGDLTETIVGGTFFTIKPPDSPPGP